MATAPPVLVSTVPADDATVVFENANLIATFNIPIVAGTGDITIRTANADSTGVSGTIHLSSGTAKSGASGALLLIAALLMNPGDGMLMADPGYPCNRHFMRLVEGHGQLVPPR